MQTANASLVVGRGELYFEQFVGDAFIGDGERYLGNTPGFSLQAEVEDLPRFASYGGRRHALESEIVQENYSANVMTDNIAMENVAMWMGTASPIAGPQEATNFITETFAVRPGRHYQLGKTHVPYGVRHVEPDIQFFLGSTATGSPIDIPSNFELRRVEGRFYVVDGAEDITAGTIITVRFQWRTSPSRAISAGAKEIRGALRFVAINPVGASKSYYFPYVRMRARGQIDLKGDQWQQMSFDVEVRKLNRRAAYFYALEAAPPLLTEDERAIVELGPLDIDRFPFFEDRLNQIINVDLPDAHFDA